MPKIIDVPNQGRVEFPDSMSDDDITAAIKRNAMSYPAKSAAPGERNLSSLITGAPAAPAPLSRMDKILKGIRDPIDGGAQLLTNMLPQGLVDAGNSANNWLADKTGMVGRLPAGGVDQQVRDAEQQYQAQRAAQGESGFDGYRTIGNVASPLNLVAASRIPAAASLAGRVGIGAAAGAGSAALNPVGNGEFAEEKLKQMAAGGAMGAAAPAVIGGLGRVISPNASRNPNLQLLKSEGVRPTVGQALGGGFGAAEEKAQSIPIMGDMISVARRQAADDFNKAAINRALGPVGGRAQQTGQAGVKDAGDEISKAYNDALSQINGVQLDQTFNQSLQQLRGMATGLTTEMQKKFDRQVNETLLRKVSPNGIIHPQDYKAIDSELGNLASRYGKSQVASEQELSDAVTQLQSLLNQQMRRSNPQVAQQLDAADEAWANLVRVEGASKAAKNNEGVFSPAQLNGAISAADDSVRKRAVGRGTALMQDLGNAGQQVLGNKVPNSGTADRAMLAKLAVGLGAGAVSPAIPAGLIAGAGAYTNPVQRGLVNLVSTRGAGAPAAAQSVRALEPYMAQAGGNGLNPYSGQQMTDEERQRQIRALLGIQ